MLSEDITVQIFEEDDFIRSQSQKMNPMEENLILFPETLIFLIWFKIKLSIYNSIPFLLASKIGMERINFYIFSVTLYSKYVKESDIAKIN